VPNFLFPGTNFYFQSTLVSIYIIILYIPTQIHNDIFKMFKLILSCLSHNSIHTIHVIQHLSTFVYSPISYLKIIITIILCNNSKFINELDNVHYTFLKRISYITNIHITRDPVSVVENFLSQDLLSKMRLRVPCRNTRNLDILILIFGQ